VQVGPGFNRDYWARFEKFIKETAKASDGVYIVTGPLWLPQPDGRGTGKWEMKHPMIGEQCSNYHALDFVVMWQ
jgi:endonuclease G